MKLEKVIRELYGRNVRFAGGDNLQIARAIVALKQHRKVLDDMSYKLRTLSLELQKSNNPALQKASDKVWKAHSMINSGGNEVGATLAELRHYRDNMKK